MAVHKAAAQARTARRATAAAKPPTPGRKGEVFAVAE